MPRYNHAFDIAFTLVSNTEDGSDVTPVMLKHALLARIAELDASHTKGGVWIEAVGAPFDTYQEEDTNDG